VVLFKNPPRCTLHHSEPSKVVGKECKIVKDYGQRVEGYLKAPKNKTHEMAASSQVGAQMPRGSMQARVQAAKNMQAQRHTSKA
jgi:hypothetical protein